MRRIVIPVRGDGKGDNVFAHAAALARRFSAHVVVTHCRARVEDMVPFGVPITAGMKRLLASQARDVADQVESGMLAEMTELASRFGVPITDAPARSGPSASWVEQQGRQVDVIKRHGRLADLVCVAKPDVDRNLGANTLKAALFNTGRPVMMCPPRETPPQELCARVSVAWNGSAEASRAVALTLDVLERADRVDILTSGAEIDGVGAEALAEYLAERGVRAGIERFTTRKRIGLALLEASAGLGADTMIMGAYGQSHERETVFGGNTQQVVDRSTMPVILVH